MSLQTALCQCDGSCDERVEEGVGSEGMIDAVEMKVSEGMEVRQISDKARGF